VSTGSDGRHALVVATARYSDPKLQQLRAPAADAERLAEVLRDPAKGNFDVEVLTDERYATLTRRIAGFFRDRRPNDLLLLHFSCHGVKDDRGDLYLAATDTELDLLSATGVSAAWLNDQISRTRSRRTVVLLDCCFSGSFPFGMRARSGTTVNAPEQFEGRGRAIITASSGMEYAYEGDHLNGEGQPSVFTEAVVEGLETGKADLDQDQLVSVDDLYGYVYDRVKESTPSQTPNKKSEIEGPLYLARSTYRPQVQPATLDPELIARTEDRYAGIRVGAVQELAHLLTSRDPAVVLAAREALSRMIDDDSRQVSASAQAALADAEEAERAHAEAERAERVRADRERAERDQAEGDRADTERARVEPAEVSAADRADAGNSSIEPARTAGAAVARERRRASWPRRHARLTLTAAVIALAAAGGAIIATQGGGGGQNPSPEPAYQALLTLLPASIQSGCQNKGAEQWMVTTPHQARAQAYCGGPNFSYYLAYGLWPSPARAQNWARNDARDDRSNPCSSSTTNAMKNILPRATTECEDVVTGPQDKGVNMWWNEDGSRVGGWLGWNTHDQHAALKQWQKVVKAP
jgi:hypothetical protein